MKTETCSPAQHKIKYDVLYVKCLSFNIELQHIGMSSIKLNSLANFFISCSGNDLQIITVPTNAQFYYYVFRSYIFRHNCHHPAANIYIAKTYSNIIFLQCLRISNVQITAKNFNYNLSA